MTRSDFDALVEALEQKYAGRRRALAWRTALVAAIGYAGFLLWVLSIAGVGVLCFVAAVATPPEAGVVLVIVGACILGVALYQAAAVLWLPTGEEKEVQLRPAQAPELFALLARLRNQLRMPKIHRVLINVEMNASIRRHSRLGLLGWTHNIMTLGLPLLDILTPTEFESVAAHESAHLSPRHGRFGAWTYRVRGTWLQLIARMQEPPLNTFSRTLRRLLGRFFNWYWQRFHAYFFVTSRQHEYEADRCAADWAGADAAAAALWRIDVCSRRMEQRFWPELWRQAATAPQPPTDVSRQLLEFFASPADDFDSAKWRWHAVAHLTDNSDTHPCLSRRVAAFGGSLARCESLGVPRPPALSAAQKLIGPELDEIRRQADAAWRDAALPAWQARHHRAALLNRRVRELQSPANSAAVPSAATLWEIAAAVAELDGSDAAEPLFRDVLAARPSHAAANLALGRTLLERSDAEGETYLRRSLNEPDNPLVVDACHLLARHYQLTGQADAMRSIHEDLSAFEQAQNEAPGERAGVSAADRFIAAELPDGELESLHTALASERELAEAYLARKRLRHAAQRGVFVLCVRTRRGFFGGSSAAADIQLVARLIPKVRLPGSVLIIAPHRGFRALAKKIMATPGTQQDLTAIESPGLAAREPA